MGGGRGIQAPSESALSQISPCRQWKAPGLIQYIYYRKLCKTRPKHLKATPGSGSPISCIMMKNRPVDGAIKKQAPPPAPGRGNFNI